MVETIDTGAHRHVGAAFTAVNSDAIRVHRERCAKVRNRNVDCLKCAAACTSGCISLKDGELVIDAAKCVGCGTCATVCPTCALESLNPTDAELKAACVAAACAVAPTPAEVEAGLAPAEPPREVVVACSQAQAALGDMLAPGSCASVVCAGRVDESLLAGLAAEYIGRVTVLCGLCDRCEQRHGRATAELVAETTRLVLDAWDCAMEVVVTDVPPSSVLREGTAAHDALEARDAYFAEERACPPVRREVEAPESSVAERQGHGPCPTPLVDISMATSSSDGSTASGSSSSVDGESDALHLDSVGQGPCPCRPDEEDLTAADKTAASVSLSSPEAEAADATVGPGMRFFWNSGHSRKVAAHSMHVMKDGTLPHFLPDRRERLLDALAQLGEPAPPKLECRLWGAVVIDAMKCESCRMCATFCPTGAIAKFDNPDGTLGVTHTPADCVKCGSCQDICPADAITLLDAVPTSWLVNGESHRYDMTPRAVQLTDNPHQILETFRLSFNGDIFER